MRNNKKVNSNLSGNYETDKFIFPKGSLITIFSVLLYRLTLDFIYVVYISEKWNYTGFTLDYSIARYSISMFGIFIALVGLLWNLKKQNPSNYIVVLLNLVAFIPATTLIAFMETKNEFSFLLILYWGIMNLSSIFIPQIKLARLPKKQSNFIFNILVIVFALTALFVSFYYTGFRINFDLSSVYDFREEALSYSIPTVLNYIFSASRAVVPTVMVYYLAKKQNIKFLMFLIIGLLIYSFNGQRAVLFSIMLSILGYFFYKDVFSYYFSIALLSINLYSLIEVLFEKNSMIADIFIRRALFVPQLLNYNYFDFFSTNEFDYFRQSLLSTFGFNSPYETSITVLIGSLYQGGNANNGLFSDAYYNLGIVGMFIMPIMIILALRIFDACSKGLSNRVLIASIITVTFNFVSSSFFTILLTHGFVAICVILYVMPRDSNNLIKIEQM